MTSILNTLNKELTEDDIRLVVQFVFDNKLCDADSKDKRYRVPRTKSFGKAKDLNEFFELVENSIRDNEKRAGVLEANWVEFTQEEPDSGSATETITVSLIRREPGAFGQGPPFQGTHVNLRPMFREEGKDPNYPGYRLLTLGYWYDNLVRFTCWAKSNKVANKRAEWFENLMEEYSWWFKVQGVDRTIFQGRQQDVVTTIKDNKWYGRPIDFYVRTEKIRVFSEKTIEEILVKYKVQTE